MAATAEASQQKRIYIVISQTGTVVSRILKLITRAPYNHVSIGLSDNLRTMYSFARKHTYNPFLGGFVHESPDEGTFKRFSNTRVIVLAIGVSPELYGQIRGTLEEMHTERNRYHYNYLGLLLAAFRICHTKENHFYCSEFVKYILQTYHIEGADELEPIVKPIHFLELPFETVYRGKLCDVPMEGFSQTVETTL